MDVHIGAAARRSGLSVNAIRYYETSGLVEGGRRDEGGRRVFSSEDVRWLVFVRHLRDTGMPIAEIRQCVQSRRAGAAGVDGVLAVLRRHQHSIDAQRARLAECAELIEAEIAKYQHLADTGRPAVPPQADRDTNPSAPRGGASNEARSKLGCRPSRAPGDSPAAVDSIDRRPHS